MGNGRTHKMAVSTPRWSALDSTMTCPATASPARATGHSSTSTPAIAPDAPIVGTVEPWQQMFVWVGLPGVLIALLVLTIREPVRREYLRTGVATAASPVWETLRFIFSRWRAFIDDPAEITRLVNEDLIDGLIVLPPGVEPSKALDDAVYLLTGQGDSSAFPVKRFQPMAILDVLQHTDPLINIARHTGQPEDQVRKDSARDKYFNAMEAKEYGLVDEVITELPKDAPR